MISSFVFDCFYLKWWLERSFHKRISIYWKGNKLLRVLVFYPPEKFFTPSPTTILIQTPITCVICPNFLVLINRMRMVVEGVKNFSEWGKKLLENGGKKLLRNNRVSLKKYFFGLCIPHREGRNYIGTPKISKVLDSLRRKSHKNMNKRWVQKIVHSRISI